MRTKLPWMLTLLLAITLVTVLVGRASTKPPAASAASTTTQKKVLFWVDPMNPTHKSDKPGKAPDGMDLVPVYAGGESLAAPPANAKKRILYWVDPMHPAYKSDKPGKAPDCGMELVPVYQDGASPATSTVSGYANVKLTSDRQQLIGVQTGMAEVRSLGPSVRTVGRVAVDERRLYKVTTKFDGYIEKLYVNVTGQQIRRGQPLFTVYSPDLLATQQEYLLALRVAKQAPSLLVAARQRLLLWDITAAEIQQLESTGAARKTVTIYSPTNGYVLNKIAVEGARVTAGEPLFEIANLDHLWIQADVYESELQYIRLGAPATATLSYIPGRTWTGSVTFIAPTVDPLTRTVKVRSEFDNADGALKPDMFGDVVIQQPTRQVVVVPDSAVLQTGTRSVVFVVKGDGSFEPREVSVGTKSEQFYEVRNGLKAGEKVVTQANFLIDSESRLKAALAAMKPEGMKPETRNQKPEGAGHVR
ncbi:MAG TPA: efflux RND transporter periplasmic adaptor subunit [Thermoanaerobaculia bacterium]|nr:efflux RND transporter periplasmic adaptor subunit [Thermoanaerobaculia bacterium]